MGLGSATGALGAIFSGQSARMAAEYNAQIAEQNARLTLQQGAEDERKTRVIARKTLGQMRANYGASGVTMEGSPVEIMAESAAAAELDALNVRYQAQSKAAMLRAGAQLDLMQGKNAETAGYINAAAALFNGGANMGATLADRKSVV